MAQPSKIVASLRIKGNNKMRSLVSRQGASGGKLGRFGRPPSAVALLRRTGGRGCDSLLLADAGPSPIQHRPTSPPLVHGIHGIRCSAGCLND